MTIAEREIKGLIEEEADPIFTERTQAEVQTQIKEAFVDMLQLGSSATSSKL